MNSANETLSGAGGPPMPMVTAALRLLVREWLLRLGPQLGVHDGQLRLDQFDHGGHQVRRHHRVQRRGDQARLGDADLGQVGLDRVLAEQQDDVALGEPAGQQRVRHLVRHLVGLPVGQRREPRVGVGARPADDGQLVRPAPGHPLDQVADAHPLPAVDGAPVMQAGHIEVHGASISVGHERTDISDSRFTNVLIYEPSSLL